MRVLVLAALAASLSACMSGRTETAVPAAAPPYDALLRISGG